MGIESVTYIDDFDSSNPLGTDPRSEGDNHIRLIKSGILATFPSIAGAVTATHTELNVLDGVTGGTVTASKGVVVDGSSKVDVWNVDNLSLNGNSLTSTSGDLQLAAVSGSNITLQDDADNTKEVTLDMATVSTGTERTWTFPDTDGTFASQSYVSDATSALAWEYTFDSGTTMADPGAGKIRFDNATVSSVTNLAFDATTSDIGNPDISDVIASIDDGTNTSHEGFITIRKNGAPATFAVYSVTGAVTDNTGWLQVPVTYVASGGTISNTDTLYISMTRSGNIGATGPTGSTGARGSDAGLDMTFESATTDTDQGAGKVWFNHATPSSATVLYMDDVDANSAPINSWVDSWDDSTTTALRGTVKVVQQADPAIFAVYNVTGAVTSATTYSKIPVSYVTGAGSFSDTDASSVSFSRTGDKGATGATGGSIPDDNSVSGAKIAMGSDAQGDVLYYGGTDYERLGAGTSGQFLKTQGAGANPAWASFDLINADINASAAIATSKLSGAVTSITSHGLATSATTDMTDMGNAASGTLAVARGGTGTTTYTALMKAVYDGTPDTDHTANGPQTNTFASGYSSTIMDLVYLGSGGKWLEADADATGTSINLLGIALEAKTDTQAMNVALPGSFVRDDTWAWTPGVPLYVSGTLGAITATKPTGSGDVVRTVGYAVHADMIYFNPSSDYVTLA